MKNNLLKSDLSSKEQGRTDCSDGTTIKKRTAIAILTAITTLQEFTQKKQNPKKNSIIQNIILPFFSQKRRDRERDAHLMEHRAILDAVHTIQSNHLFLAKFNEGGNDEEKQLAELALTTVNSFNAVVEKGNQYTALWNRFLSHQPTELQKIEISHFISVQKPRHTLIQKKIRDAFLSQLMLENTHTTATLMTSEGDAIRLKAMCLLRQKGYQPSFKTWSDALAAIESAPIQVNLDAQTRIATLSMQLIPVPGTIIKIIGSFQRHHDSSLPSTPLRNSFQLMLHADQTGFPQPAQYTGWALSDVLLPFYPHHLKQVPLFRSLYTRKETTRVLLMPDGKLVEKAQKLHQIKTQTFNKNTAIFIQKHRNLVEAILRAAPKEWLPEHQHDIIESYFNYLKNHPTPFQCLSTTYHVISQRFLVLPFNKLIDAWLEDHLPALFDQDSLIVQHAVTEIFEQERLFQMGELHTEEEETALSNERAPLAFIAMLGNIFGQAGQAICLQYLSEPLGYAPPLLNDFAQKIQAAAFGQLHSFLNELEWSEQETNPNVVMANWEKGMQADLELFKADSIESVTSEASEIVDEFELYFNTQYYNSLKQNEAFGA